jgi:hypothetical protein
MGKTVVLVGPPRQDMSAASIVITVISVPGPQLDPDDPRDFFAGMTSSMQRTGGFTNWQETPFELGQVNGLKFARLRWSGVVQQVNRRLKGFIYVTFQGPTVVSISGQDGEAYEADSLKLLETAVLSCHGSGQP